MDCRQFRENHFAFVDDTLPGIELVGMQMHITECDQCAKHDAAVRRSLMLFRNLPPIEPSPEFSSRLEARLRAVRVADALAVETGRSRKLAATVAITSAVMLGYIGFSLREVDSAQSISLPPVFAIAAPLDSTPATMTSPSPAMVAAISAGAPIWTVALVAEQTPVHFASLELSSTSR